MLFGLLSCRGDGLDTAGSEEQIVVFQGIYRKANDRQLALDCANSARVVLRDTPSDALRRQCALFDHPEGTVLWLDLEGVWQYKPDSTFLIRRINRMERRPEGQGCR